MGQATAGHKSMGTKVRLTFVPVVVSEVTDFGRDIEIISFVYSILITLFFSAVVNFFMHFRLKKVDMVESMKSVE